VITSTVRGANEDGQVTQPMGAQSVGTGGGVLADCTSITLSGIVKYEEFYKIFARIKFVLSRTPVREEIRINTYSIKHILLFTQQYKHSKCKP
jgi:hypothetical protein